MTKDSARAALQLAGLRVTAPRVAVLRVLARSARPLSHTEVVDKLGKKDWDPATLYRNLVKLRDAGLAPVVSRADGVDRYAFASREGDGHRHPHFVCDDCGQVACLPSALSASIVVEGPWATSVQQAMVQLRGECPDCLAGLG
jgi:Fur family ferric uptake transcriptional regulator